MATVTAEAPRCAARAGAAGKFKKAWVATRKSGAVNARVGDMDDAKIVEDGEEELWSSMERFKNQDALVNITGKIITQIARSSTNMFIMNGRTLPNEFTFKQVDEKNASDQ